MNPINQNNRSLGRASKGEILQMLHILTSSFCYLIAFDIGRTQFLILGILCIGWALANFRLFVRLLFQRHPELRHTCIDTSYSQMTIAHDCCSNKIVSLPIFSFASKATVESTALQQSEIATSSLLAFEGKYDFNDKPTRLKFGRWLALKVILIFEDNWIRITRCLQR